MRYLFAIFCFHEQCPCLSKVECMYCLCHRSFKEKFACAGLRQYFQTRLLSASAYTSTVSKPIPKFSIFFLEKSLFLSLVFYPKIPEDEFTATVCFGGRVIKADTHHSFLSTSGILMNRFTVVEESFSFLSFEILQNKWFSLGFLVNSFTIVEFFSDFRAFRWVSMQINWLEMR